MHFDYNFTLIKHIFEFLLNQMTVVYVLFVPEYKFSLQEWMMLVVIFLLNT